MMDDALMRPGRLEVQIEIGLPGEKGRRQIFTIHTRQVNISMELFITLRPIKGG